MLGYIGLVHAKSPQLPKSGRCGLFSLFDGLFPSVFLQHRLLGEGAANAAGLDVILVPLAPQGHQLAGEGGGAAPAAPGAPPFLAGSRAPRCAKIACQNTLQRGRFAL